MDIWTLISGVGLGAIGAKLLEIIWLQNKLNEQKHSEWLRERRLEAFAEVTKEFISFGMHSEGVRTPFQMYGVISRAILLIDDDGLVERLDRFVVDFDEMNRLTDEKKSGEAEAKYKYLVAESRKIATALRTLMLHDKVRN